MRTGSRTEEGVTVIIITAVYTDDASGPTNVITIIGLRACSVCVLILHYHKNSRAGNKIYVSC